MTVVWFYHTGRDAAHRERARALDRDGVELTLVVPTLAGPDDLSAESCEDVPRPVLRRRDVSRHDFAHAAVVAELIGSLNPDVVDLPEESFSVVVRQMLRVHSSGQPIVTYAARCSPSGSGRRR